MVHLASVPSDDQVNAPLVKGLEKVQFEKPSDDEVTASVYGSKFAAEDLPKHEMPESEMPKEIAYRMIKDELSLDGNPMLNLASFVTTYMVITSVLPNLGESFVDGETGRRGGEADGGSLAEKLHRLRGIPTDC